MGSRGAPWRLRKGIKHFTHTRSDINFWRGTVYLSQSKVVVSREETLYSHRARRFFIIYVGIFYVPHVGRHGIVRAVPC